MRTVSHTSAPIRPWPLVALAAWVVPGLGHVLIGHALRGVIIGTTLLGLFLGGLLIGGIDVVDRREAPLWFAGQVMLGPVAIVAQNTHDRLEAQRSQQFEDAGFSPHGEKSVAIRHFHLNNIPMAYQDSIGRVNEIGTLYCALAGVLNLLAILDVVGKADDEQDLPTASEDELLAHTPDDSPASDSTGEQQSLASGGGA